MEYNPINYMCLPEIQYICLKIEIGSDNFRTSQNGEVILKLSLSV
jgi:hypothetical protein